jgi:HD-GYP domain-containing protein (c-di-GMP phosphodiesterase class II)
MHIQEQNIFDDGLKHQASNTEKLSVSAFDLTRQKLDILREVSSAVANSESTDSVSELVLELVLKYLHANIGSVMLIDEEKQELFIKTSRGIEEDLISEIRVRIGEGICGYVAGEKKPLLIKDVTRDVRFKKIGHAKYENNSLICAPIHTRNHMYGVISVNNRADGAVFTVDDLELVTILADQAAIAFENARLIETLKGMNLKLSQSNKRLIESDKMKTDFISRLSHELRVPLFTIKGAAHYLKTATTIDRQKNKEFINIICGEISRLERHIEDLFDFSRLQDETKILKKSSISLTKSLKTTLALKFLQNLIDEKSITITSSFDDKASNIWADQERLHQILLNLLINSIKYAKKGDTIRLSVTDTKTDVMVLVLIVNRKIPEDEIPFIFDKETVHLGMKKPKKTDLELYIVRRLVDLHDGSIDASNEPEGLTFSVILPKVEKVEFEKKLHQTLNMFLSFISDLMEVNIASIMLFDENKGELRITSAQGLDEDVIRNTRIKMGERIAGWVAMEGKPLLIEDVEQDFKVRVTRLPKYNTKSLLSIPIKVNNKVFGVLNLNNKKDRNIFDVTDFYLASVFSDRIGILIRKFNENIFKPEMLSHLGEELEALLNALKIYDKKSKNLIKKLVTKTGSALGLNEEDIKILNYTALLYDLGLTQIDDKIIKKDRKLNRLEYKVIKKHPFTTISLIESIEFAETVKNNIIHHHERFDGLGYPEGLAGDNIPVGARIIAIVDAYMAMIAERPYRKAMSKREAISELIRGAGNQFDPKIVEVFLNVLKENN